MQLYLSPRLDLRGLQLTIPTRSTSAKSISAHQEKSTNSTTSPFTRYSLSPSLPPPSLSNFAFIVVDLRPQTHPSLRGTSHGTHPKRTPRRRKIMFRQRTQKHHHRLPARRISTVILLHRYGTLRYQLGRLYYEEMDSAT